MAMLISEQLVSIDALGFQQLLSMEVDAVESRNLLPWVMDIINPDTMVMRIDLGKVLPINAQVVSIVLGLPNVGIDLCHHSWREGVQAKRDLVEQLALDYWRLGTQYHLMGNSAS
uniref:Uncharacterized protein n=1 Tax=Arundo donax TaxID=35708 RepID=A0A0A9CUW6_ARUDO